MMRLDWRVTYLRKLFQIAISVQSNTMKQQLAAALASVILLAAPVAGHGALVGIGFGGSVYSINETTGAGALLGSSGFGATNSMARHSAGTLYSATPASLITINPVTGAGTLAPALSGFGAEGLSIRGLAFSSAGVLYAVNNGGSPGDTTTNDLLYTINASTGAMTLIGTMAFAGVQALAFSSGSTLYGFDSNGGGLITIDPLTAAATDVNPAIGGSGNDIQTIAFSSGGTLYGGRDNLFTIDLTTGASTLVGGGSGGTFVDVRGMEFLAAAAPVPVPVPEPGTLALLGIGVVGLGFCRRKRTS